MSPTPDWSPTAITPGDVTDSATGIGLLDDEVPGLEIYADSAYGSGDTRAELRDRGHDPVIKPIPLRRAIPGRV